MSRSQNAGGLPGRQENLIKASVHCLRQGLRLLEEIDDRMYVEPPPGFAPHRVGAHLRHVLEFYECFLTGLECSHIDYDSRKRDESVEASRTAAVLRIKDVIRRLEENRSLRGDSIIWVRMEDSPETGGGDPFLTSSMGRELQVLSSHTIHHFALIAMTLRAWGIVVDHEFGMAPSTLRYLRQRKAAAEAA